MSAKPFLIIRTSTMLNLVGNDQAPDEIFLEQWSLTDFLQRHNLVTRTLAKELSEIDETSAIFSDDLTPLGLDLMRAGLDKWRGKLDRGGDPKDVSILEKALKKLQGQ